jgi:hypothetical protein
MQRPSQGPAGRDCSCARSTGHLHRCIKVFAVTRPRERAPASRVLHARALLPRACAVRLPCELTEVILPYRGAPACTRAGWAVLIAYRPYSACPPCWKSGRRSRFFFSFSSLHPPM